MRRNFPKRLAVAFAILAAVIGAYLPGLHGPFVFDDEIHILQDPSIRISALNVASLEKVVAPHGSLSLSRPLSKVTLAVNSYASANTESTFGYKLTNVAIHLINTALVYWLSLLLIRKHSTGRGGTADSNSAWIPFLVATLWALHPLHLTSVLYVVQRMTSLGALCVFAGLIVSCYGRQRIHEGRKQGYLLMVLGAVGGSTLGLGFKENAVVLLPLLLVIEFVFFGIRSETRSDQRKLALFYSLTILLPAIGAGLWLVTHPHFVLDAYVAREFNLGERLLTQPRILWFYVSLLFLPVIGRFSLFHDDIPVSSGWLEPWTTSAAILGLVTAITLAIVARRKHPFLSFAILWYLVGHSVESTFIGLEIAHEHRNYLPDFGIVLVAAYGLWTLAYRFQQPIRYLILLTPVIVLGFVTGVRAHTWSSEEGIIESLARHHPNSASTQFMLAELYAEKKQDPVYAQVHYTRAIELAPREVGYRIKSLLLMAKMGDESGHKLLAARDASSEAEMIRQQLGNQPLTASTINILEQLASCTDQASPFCRALYPATRDWYLAAIENPAVSDRDLARFVVHLFNLGTTRGDLDLSLRAARAGMRLAPNDLDYSLMEANVHLLRGDLDTAEQHLLAIQSDHAKDMTHENRESLQVLLTSIASKRAHRATGQPPPK